MMSTSITAAISIIATFVATGAIFESFRAKFFNLKSFGSLLVICLVGGLISAPFWSNTAVGCGAFATGGVGGLIFVKYGIPAIWRAIPESIKKKILKFLKTLGLLLAFVATGVGIFCILHFWLQVV